MATIQQLEKEVNKKFESLEPEELKLLIKNLVKEYYKSFFENNTKTNQSILNTLRLVVSCNSNLNTSDYVNYCLLNEVNSIINRNVESNIDLVSFEKDLVKGKNSELLESLKTPLPEIHENLSDMLEPETIEMLNDWKPKS